MLHKHRMKVCISTMNITYIYNHDWTSVQLKLLCARQIQILKYWILKEFLTNSIEVLQKNTRILLFLFYAANIFFYWSMSILDFNKASNRNSQMFDNFSSIYFSMLLAQFITILYKTLFTNIINTHQLWKSSTKKHVINEVTLLNL